MFKSKKITENQSNLSNLWSIWFKYGIADLTSLTLISIIFHFINIILERKNKDTVIHELWVWVHKR
jgi:hypothetical protein